MPTSYISIGQLFNVLKSLTTKISPATQSTAGLLSASDKVKLDCIGSTGVIAEPDIIYEIGAPKTIGDSLHDAAKAMCYHTRLGAHLCEDVSSTTGLSYNPSTNTYTDEDGNEYEEDIAQIYLTTLIQANTGITDEQLSTSTEGMTSEGLINMIGDWTLFLMMFYTYGAYGNDDLSGDAINAAIENISTYLSTKKEIPVSFSESSTTTYTATQSVNGLMSAVDKKKLDNIPDTLDFAAKTHTHVASEITGRLSDSQLPTSVLSSTTASAITAIPTTHRQVIATISASASFKFNGSAAFGAGREVHVIIKNSGSAAITVTLPNSGIYKTDNATLSIPASSYAEVNAISDGSAIYLRSVV